MLNFLARARQWATYRPVLGWRCLWLLIIFLGESGLFHLAAWRCSWPDSPVEGHSSVGNILVVADPQLTDAYSYGQHGVVLAAVQSLSDVYMRKAFTLLAPHLAPTSLLFLGDLFDGGREWDDTTQWEEELARFRHVFPPILGPGGGDKGVEEVERIWVGGNHDYGFGNGVDIGKRLRWERAFGPTNSVHGYGLNTRIVVLDTVSLSASHPNISEASEHFLNAWNTTIPITPSASSISSWSSSPQKNFTARPILISHVPIYRKPGSGCGRAHRTGGGEITMGWGYQYQDLLTPRLSQRILSNVQPTLILSGDDHDQCEVHHSIPPSDDDSPISAPKKALEYTVGTFSFMQGNLIPSAGLLSLFESSDGKSQSFAYSVCYLPDQLWTYTMYGILAAAALCHVLIARLARLRRNRRLFPFYSSSSNVPRSMIEEEEMLHLGPSYITHLPERQDRVGGGDDESSPLAPLTPSPSPSSSLFHSKRQQHLSFLVKGVGLDVIRILPFPLCLYLFLHWYYM
ncbi:MAG: hypothetical protein DHS80DRAFT_11635 [Piptocephalis tieghemiana]|nr:MAG: hypothetical protein DHS80DRAFT_11635 [Piptocephalis tieghemiana]